MTQPKKKKLLETVKPKKYRIYGIFDFQTKKLLYINLDAEMVDLEFKLSGYDEDRYDIVEFDVLLV